MGGRRELPRRRPEEQQDQLHRLTAFGVQKTDHQAEIEATTIPPPNELESAIVRTLAPGAYTAIVKDAANRSGIGLVEIYHLSSTGAISPPGEESGIEASAVVGPIQPVEHRVRPTPHPLLMQSLRFSQKGRRGGRAHNC